jgi:hypothetical protein
MCEKDQQLPGQLLQEEAGRELELLLSRQQYFSIADSSANGRWERAQQQASRNTGVSSV